MRDKYLWRHRKGYKEEEITEPGKEKTKKGGKKKFIRKRFTDRAGMVLIVSSVSVILIVLFLFIRYEQGNKLNDLLINGATLTNMIANSSIQELKKNEQEQLLKIINLMAREKGLLYGMIMGTDNKIVAHTEGGFINTTMSDPISLKAASSNNPLKQIYQDPLTGKMIYEFSRPISYNGKKIGIIRLGFTPDAYNLISKDDMRVFAIIALCIFILVPISYYMMYSLIHPIKVLNTKIEDLIKEGLQVNEFKMIQPYSEGEVGVLIERFNMMISFFKDKYIKLSESNKEIDVSNKILSYEKKRIEAVLDNINDGIMVADSSRKIILANKAMENIANINKEETIGKDIRECFDHPMVRDFISEGISQGNTYIQRNIELTIEKPKGEDIVRIYYMPLLDNRENSIGSLIIVKDLTTQKMAEKAQINFLSSISHELKSPLTTIKSYTEMLVDGEVNTRDTQIEFYNIINEETYRLERLIENLITISKIEIGSLTIDKNIVKPIPLLEETAKLMKPHAISKGIRFETILPDNISPLLIDKDLIQTAIINLLSNAIKYTPEGGNVTLRAEENNTHTLIHVIDTGYGISEEELPYIYDKFFRSSREEIKDKPGSGMGLSLVKEIISLHNGDIRTLSKLGRGTQFTLLLLKEEVVLH
ncbi:MAG: PAS domain-containing protein [Nitrospinae bacterium]|nr:PAS domain-containing protein [Nitrospinota bacterium]